MSNKVKFLIFAVLLIPFLILFNSNNPNYPHFIFSDSSKKLNSLNGGEQYYVGSYEGDLAIMYTWTNWSFIPWSNQNTSTQFASANVTNSGYLYDLNRIEISAYGLTNGSDNLVIAENETAQSNVTKCLSIAQEFTTPNSSYIAIYSLWLYLNYTLPIPKPDPIIFQVLIYDENLQEELDICERWEYNPTSPFAGWKSFWFSRNILNPNTTYNFLFRVRLESGEIISNMSYWKAETYNSSVYNKGFTKVWNGSNWSQIANDTERDMLCRFDYDILIHPASIDLKFIIDGQIVIPNYQPHPWVVGYQGYLMYNFATRPTKSINVTVTINQNLTSMNIDFNLDYVYLRNATGIFNATENQIEWNMTYPYKEIVGGMGWDFFLFESDWSFINFYDPDNYEIEDIFFGSIDLCNVTYYGIFNLWGMPFERGNHTGIFQSPNYCTKLRTQIKNQSGIYQDVLTYKIGDTIKLQAEIKNSKNEPISGGSGQIQLISPSGSYVCNETGLNSTNGMMNSSDILLGGSWGGGTYEIRIFWTNGKEIAIYSMYIEVRSPEEQPFIPPILQPSITTETLILFGIIAGVAAAATPIGLVTRRHLQQRNWEKTLRNLFVLSKQGLSMYAYTFGIEIQDPELISGMIAALTAFVREATGSKKQLRTIDHEDKKVILSHGQNCISALLADKDLPIMHKRTKKFTDEFEDFYHKYLKSWDGNVRIFKGADKIVIKHFPVDVEAKIIRGVRDKLIEFQERIKTIFSPKDVISMMREITEFSTRYQSIINLYYMKEFNEIIKIAEEKISAG
ncbi:MAG: hypothetical protein HWN67_15750 [Candidatus Helarchaeota archaeon]|nr:hypothetical protein [Candidatus Helarchaeota archaeon]